jgi:HK97 family phage portal protein
MPGIIERIRMAFSPKIYMVSLGSDAPTEVLNYTARTLYQSQDNLQAVVNFLADSIAQLPLKVYRRNGENARIRDRESVTAQLLYKPNRYQTEFEFIKGMAVEYLVFGCVYVWVIPSTESKSGYEMMLIPTSWVEGTEGGNSYAADYIRVSMSNGEQVLIPRSEWVRFAMYSAGNPGGYISPISGLRQTLQEQIEASKFRRQLWGSSGRLNAQILRPKDVAPWTPEQRSQFVENFRQSWGSGGSKAGSIPLLEDGMEIKPFSTSFKEAEWASSVKLSRESVAAAYQINPSLVWHSDTQTYASSKDNARALYAECLGPKLQMIQQRINTFLIPMIGGDENLYCEFDLREKLKGSFEERAAELQKAVGGPWMTRDEARADSNLPPLPDGIGSEIIIPLNVASGSEGGEGTEEPTSSGDDAKHVRMVQKSATLRIKGTADDSENDEVTNVIKKFMKHQAASILPKLGAKSADSNWWDEDRWNTELAADLEPIVQKVADKHGLDTAEVLGTEYGIDLTRNYIKTIAKNRAKGINKITYDKLMEALEAAEQELDNAPSPSEVMEKRKDLDSPKLGQSLATMIASWAICEAANQAYQQGYSKQIKKTWVTGSNPRSSHAALNGETVPIDDVFSNGARWPGDDNLSPEESCGCNCSTEVEIAITR